jgi:hypothetical protein
MAISKITTNALNDSAITTDKIAAGAVATVDIADTAVTTAKTGFSSETSAISVPSGTTGQRPASPVTGMIRFNTTVAVLEQYATDGWVGIEPAPTISSITLPGSQTAVTDGDTVTINGTSFKAGATVKFIASGGTQYTSPTVTRVSSAQLTAVITTSIAEGTYQLVVNNPSGLGATFDNAFSVDGLPVFTTSSGSLGSVNMGSSFSSTIAATEDSAAITSFAISSGALPSGITLNTSSGVISGTPASVESDTTSSFTVRATDSENQTATRDFTITVLYASVNALLLG